MLNTREPNLANVNPESTDELEFMAQLAKEFPLIEPRPQRTTSFSLSPKLLTPELRTSVVFNRKLSLPLNGTEQRRSLLKESFKMSKSPESNRNSIAESDLVLNENDFNKECRSSVQSDKSVNGGKYKCGKHRQEPEKSSSPPMGSISSAEDESGFSSMNSFQEVGLPLVNSTCEEVTSKEALLRSMLNGNTDANYTTNNDKCHSIDDVKLWQKPDSYIYHKRRNSSPADTSKEKTSLKVLWV